MARSLILLGAAVAALSLSGDRARADPRNPQIPARQAAGILGSAEAISQVREPTPAPPAGDALAQTHHPHHYPHPGDHGHPHWLPPHGLGYDYGFDVYPWPPPYPYPPYYERYYFPPLVLPAETLYGPQALKRFLGWDNWNRPPANVHVIVAPGGAKQGGGANEKQPNLRGTNQRSLALAWKFIGYGDAHFNSQKYSDAYQRYRKAARTAPQLAEGYFRQGYALIAMGRYELAAKAIKRGLALDPTWPRSQFRSAELYGDNQMAKKAHLEAMAKAAEDNPNDPDLLFLLGVYLHFDGQPDRADVFFERAGQLAHGDDAHLRAFEK